MGKVKRKTGKRAWATKRVVKVAGKPSFERIKQYLNETHDEILLADGFEDALIGVATVFNKDIAVYDRAKCIEILMTRDGMTCVGAEEFFDYNVTGAYVGDHTPAFLVTFAQLDKGGML